MQAKVHCCLVFNSFFVFFSGAQLRKHKKILGQTVLKMWSQIYDFFSSILPSMYFEKKVFFKADFNQLSKKLFLQSTFKAQFRFFFKNLRPHFQNSFVPTFFLCFLCQAPEWNTKKLMKIKQQCTFVYIMNFTNFYQFFGIFSALRSSF